MIFTTDKLLSEWEIESCGLNPRKTLKANPPQNLERGQTPVS
jgi:hypothetical protein